MNSSSGEKRISALLDAMEGRLRVLLAEKYPSPLDAEFRRVFDEFLSLHDEFLGEEISGTGRTACCAPGCSQCCDHWVEDVYSFEADFIAAYVRENFPDRLDCIGAGLKESLAVYDRLAELTAGKLADLQPEELEELPDETGMILTAFYQLSIPCPLLDSRGCCSVYPVRPLSCRQYINVADPDNCGIEEINDGTEATCLIDPGERINSLLGEIHLRYDRGGGSTALRRLLATRLSSG